MSVYFTTLSLVSVLLIAYSYRGFPKDVKRVFFVLITIVLVFVAGFRYRVGTDYAQYQQSYSLYKLKSLSWLSQPALTIVARISSLIYDDPATWFFLMSAITIIPVMKTITDNSEVVALSVIMYLLLGCWHYSFNLVKQSAAATIMFVAYPALRDKKCLRWCVACLIAAMFHVSAVLMIPIYFLTSSQITVKRTALIICIGVVIVLSYDLLFDLIGILKQGEGVVGRNWKISTRSVNVLRILVICVPVIVYFVFYKHYDKSDKNFATLFNLSLINAVLNIGSMNSVYLNRFCVYTNLFNVLFIPLLFKPLKSKYNWWVTPLAMVLYFAFWTYDLYKGSSTVNFYWVFNR